MSLTPPPTQESVIKDTSMTEAHSMEPASTTIHTSAATADGANQIQQQEDQQQHYSAPEQAPLMTARPLPSTFTREHPPWEPPPRQPTPRHYDNSNPPDRQPPHLPSYPTAPDLLPQTSQHPGMSDLGLVPRTRTSASVERVPPPRSSYPNAPASASQTPQPTRSQTPQQAVSAAGWLKPSAATSASKITFEGTFSTFLFPPSVLSPPSSLGKSKRPRRKGREGRGKEKRNGGGEKTRRRRRRKPMN